MKKKLLMLSAVAICLAIFAAGSLAYFTSQDTAHNVITTGGVEIRLNEWANADRTEPFKDLEGMMPGVSVTKIAEVENTGTADAWVRVLVKKDVTVKEQTEVAPSDDLITLDLNDAFWTLGNDGYLYYKDILKPGETTEPIFTKVGFAPEMGNEFQGATVTVDVLAQAVQTAHNGATVMEAQGWPAANP